MKPFRLAAFVIALTLASAPAWAQRPAIDYSDLVAKLRPSVVSLTTTETAAPVRNPFAGLGPAFERFAPDEPSEPRTHRADSSGFVFDAAQGLIITTDYVLDEGAKVEVRLASGATRPAEIVGYDNVSGIGLMRVAPAGLVGVTWADRAPRVGELALGLAEAYGLGVVAVSGIVSAVDVEVDGAPDSIFLLDMPAHKGSAGGLIVDQNGAAIGMFSAQFGAGPDAQANLGVAIPVSELRRIGALLARDGKVQHGMIGVEVTREAAGGVIVSNIEPGSPAERAGLKRSDLIKTAAGKLMTTERALSRLIASLPVGSQVQLEIERAGRPMTLGVTIEPRKD